MLQPIFMFYEQLQESARWNEARLQWVESQAGLPNPSGQPYASHVSTSVVVPSSGAAVSELARRVEPIAQEAWNEVLTAASNNALMLAFAKIPEVDAKYRFMNQLNLVFNYAYECRLIEASECLRHMSVDLVDNLVALGLQIDDEALDDDHRRVWEMFNKAWLVTLQRQCELASEQMAPVAMQTYPPTQPHAFILSKENMERLVGELVQLCDRVEAYGLVDYQMGIAEEEIVARKGNESCAD